MSIRHAILLASLPVSVAAQAPLSAIDWLEKQGPAVLTGPVLSEPPVTRNALNPPIDVRPLEPTARAVGLLSGPSALPPDIWGQSDPDTLAELIRTVPVQDYPALQAVLYTLLLSETHPPAGAEPEGAVLLARIDRLMEMGAVDAAATLAEVAGARDDPELFRRWFDAALLVGEEDRACAALAETNLTVGYGAQIFCGLRRGDWQTAALTLEAAHALEVLPPTTLDLLDRFLSPEIYEGAQALEPPPDPDPLVFRLYESIGEPLPTASLPRAFANADLRDLAGWKAQIVAAERLARVGAIPPNRLLGLYTDRSPAASGGVWDRVAAFQRFETALKQGSADGVAKTLAPAWDAMRDAHLEVPFAELFGADLAALALEDASARTLAWEVGLLSPDYAAAGGTLPDDTSRSRFLASVAHGTPQDGATPIPGGAAVADGFSGAAPLRIADLIAEGRRGEAMLRTIAMFDRGARGNPSALSGALAAFRALGLADTARRAALQYLLLERS